MIHRASSLGGCLKSQIATALGMKPIPHDEMSALRMGEGQLHEDDVVARLIMDGAAVTRQQEEVTLDTVVGHIDGVITDDFIGGPRLLEIKSMGDGPFKAFQAKGWEAGGLIDKYKWQTSVYMHALGMEMLFVTKNRNSGQITEHGVEMPFYSLDQITERVAYIEDHVARGALPDDCAHDWFCDHKYLCTRPAGEEDAAEQSSDELTPGEVSTVAEYHRLGREIKALEDLRAGSRPLVEGLAGRSGAGYHVQWVTQNVKERVVPASVRQSLRVTRDED